MMRQMADACTPANIPDGVDLVAYYVDGDCAAPAVKGKQHVGISSVATNAGIIGDCEPDNPPPAAWVPWVEKRRAAGVDPTIYCADDSLGSFFDGYKWSDVRAAFQAVKVPEPHYFICKPGATSIPAGAVACQNQLGVAGDRYDLSLVAPYWPGVDPDPPISHGGSSAMTIAIAPRPDGSGLDVFRVAADGSVGREGNVPDWVEGTDPILPGTGPGGIIARGVAAAWESPTRLVIVVIDSAGVCHQNAIATATWTPGAWQQLSGTWLVPAALSDLQPGAPGPVGPQGPPGPAYDDTAVKTELARHDADLEAIKAAAGGIQ